ncbi:MAG: chemotaxis protein histidine kinase CheA [Rhodothermales bacterium]|jgi:chemotaxis protein histidine kinase CheA
MKSDGHSPLDAASPVLGTVDDGPLQDDPYQLETMVLPRADAAGKAQLSALLDTHIMSRDAIRQMRSEPVAESQDKASPRSIGEMLVPDHVRRQSLAALNRAKDNEEIRGPVTLKDPDGLDLMLGLGVGAMDADTAHHTLTDTLLIWLIEVVNDAREEIGLDSYCDILLRLAEEVGENGMAGLAAITLRYRRTLQRLDLTHLESSDLGLGLLEWPMLVGAYLDDPSDLFHVEALSQHVDAVDENGDADFDNGSRVLQQLLREATEHQGQESGLAQQLIRQAGDAVFHAGRTHVFVDSALRRAQQLRQVTSSIAGTLDSTRASGLDRAMQALDRRLDDLRQTVTDLQGLTRSHHSDLAASATRPAGEAFLGLTQALHAAARSRQTALAVDFEGKDIAVDAEAAAGLGGPLTDVAWWLARYGVSVERPKQGQGGRARIRFARRKQALVVDLTIGAAFLEALAEETTFPDQSGWSEAIENELLRMALVGQTPDSEIAGFATRFDALHQAAVSLGGTCRLRYVSGEGALLQVRVPGWLTHTTGRLIPAGGGVLTVRQTGIDSIEEVGREVLLRGDDARLTAVVAGKRYRAMWLLDFLGLPTGGDTQDMFAVHAMLTRAGGTQLVVLAAGVSEPLGFSVRGVGERLPKVPGVVGGTVLVGGEVSPLIDLPTVVQVYLRELQRRRQKAP